MQLNRLLIPVLLTSLFISPAYAAAEAAKVKWTYQGSAGPAHWGKLSPVYAACSVGKTQTPINITHAIPEKNNLEIHYESAPLIIMENGWTELTIGSTQTITNTGHSTQVNFAEPLTREKLVFGGKSYHLVQFHFHTPSETHVQGKVFPGEIHFVNQSDDGSVAVLAVLLTTGKNNPSLQKIIDNIPHEEGVPKEIPGERIDPASLLPAQQNHYHFMGSLTTPPCSEGLEWLVLKTPVSVGHDQLTRLEAAAHGPNARPLQPLHGRRVTVTSE
jgi:carbonic anhydrase